MATNDFTAVGGDTYYVFSEGTNLTMTAVALDDALINYVSEVLDGVITAEQYGESAGRIKIVSEPAESAEETEETGESEEAQAEVYVVVAGDSLWGISERYYGTGTRWNVIYDANRDLIANQNLIYIGQELIIPEKRERACSEKMKYRRQKLAGREFFAPGLLVSSVNACFAGFCLEFGTLLLCSFIEYAIIKS